MSLVVKVGVTEIAGTKDRTWRDEYKGRGTWSFTLPNDSTDMPDFGDVVTFVDDGDERFGGAVASKSVTTLDPGEGAAQLTVLSGFGMLATTGKSLVPPSRGWDAAPVEEVRSQSWVAVDFDASGWPYSKRIRNVDTPVPYSPYRALPEWYPDKSAYEVGPDQVDVDEDDAPLGVSLYRSDPITLDEGTIEVVFGVNNKGPVWFNGFLMGDIDNSPRDANRIRFDVTAGTDHVICAQVTNFIRDTWFVASIYSVDDGGLLDTLLWSSDETNVLCLGYPEDIPGPTAGTAIRQMLENIQAEGELTDVTLDFDDDLDSAGNAWSDVSEITTDVGRSFQEYLEALSDWLIDVHMDTDKVVRAWNWGTRDSGLGPATIVATTDRTTSEVAGLTFDGAQIYANHLRIRYKHGYTEVDESGTDPKITAFLDLREIQTAAVARSIGRKSIELRKVPSWAGQLHLDPVSSLPYDSFGNGDYVDHPADPDGGTSSRVRAITRSEDENGVPTWVVELHDIHEEADARHENWLRRIGMGSLAGGSRVTSRSGESIRSAAKITDKSVGEFSFQEPVDGALTGKRPASVSGNLIELYVEVSTDDDDPTTTDTVVSIYKNGAFLDDCTVPAGETSAQTDLATQKTYRNVDRYRAEVTTVGGGVTGVDVQIRAI